MRFVPQILCLCLPLAALGCGNNSSTTATIVRPELVGVLPEDFLGTVPCVDWESPTPVYVATLFDVTPAADGTVPNPGVQLPSSPPTSCHEPVTFSFVLNLHRYRAEIDAYGGTTAGLHPLAAGARVQVDENELHVPPKWRANCYGYPLSPDPSGDTSYGAGFDAGTGEAGAPSAPGVLSYSELTQIPHNCGVGLTPAIP